ncbi:MAG: response regulator transcription factor [Pleurocapsa sp.]
MEVDKKKILIVDDDLALQHLINRFLNFNNYITETASNAQSARKIFRIFKPDLVILDVNLPDDTGFNLCREMRKTGTLIIMLSSMTDSNYILEAFDKGADDYITKPFNLQILKARVDALLRRNSGISSHSKNSIILNKLKIDLSRREAILENKVIPLTALEFDILYFLANNANRVWDRGELIAAIWNKEEYSGDDRKVDIHIGRIRKKIGDRDGKLIKTIWGRGYMFEMSDSDAVKLAD